ncbi:MAG: PAS domain S-box protein [Dehalococcoidia bacterium]|nr:PAS domain S-box protein [Dehalococcoidia bacterium]
MIGLKRRTGNIRRAAPSAVLDASTAADARVDDSRRTNVKEVSCRVSNSILKYLKSHGYDVSAIIKRLPYELSYLTNPTNWISCEARNVLSEYAADVTGDPAVMYHVGMAIPRLKPLGGVERLALLLGNPQFVYKSIPRYSASFDRLFNYTVKLQGPTMARISMIPVTDYAWSKHACYFAQGIMAAVPTLFGLPAAHVREIRCISDSRQQDVREELRESQSCEFEVEWGMREHPAADVQDSRVESKESVTTTIERLETEFEQLNRKNAEHFQRELQLSKVREVALALDSAENVDEVFRQTVTLARQIPGVEFVLAHTLDEDGTTITTRAYSPISDKPLLRQLAAPWFDFSRAPEKNAHNEVFKYPVERSTVARDFLANPCTLGGDRVAQLMDGLCPAWLCDRIQSIMQVESYVAVPITVTGELAGALIFLLRQGVQQDILEMVSAHCAAAIKNAEALEALEKRNRELFIVNEIARNMSSSLQPEEVFEAAAREMKRLMGADAVAIHAGPKSSQTMTLVAHSGMPDDAVRAAQSVSRQSQDDEISTNHTQESVRKYPQLRPAVATMSFTSCKLPFSGNRVGRLTIARRTRPFDDSDRATLCSVASHVALAVDNAYLHQELKQHAAAQQSAAERAIASESLLATSERKYRLIAENVSDYICIITLTGMWTYASPSHRNIGYEPEELIGKNALKYIHAEDQIRLAPKLARYAGIALTHIVGTHLDHFTETVIFRLKEKQGGWRNIEATASLIESLNGKGFSVLLACRDVTERTIAEEGLRKAHRELEERVQERTAQLRRSNVELQSQIVERQRAEAELRASEERFRMLFEFAPDAYYLSDMKGNIVDGNSAAQLLVGYTKEQLKSKDYHDIPFLSSQETTHALNRLTNNVASLSGGPQAFEIRRSDGEKLTVEVTTLPIELGGQSLVLRIARDMTEHKRIEDTLRLAREELERRVFERTADLTRANQELQSEMSVREQKELELRRSRERYRTIFNSVNDTLLLIGKDGTVLDVNPRIAEMGGYDPTDLVGRNIRHLSRMMPKKSLAIVLLNFTRRLAGQQMSPYQVEMVKANGQKVLIEISATAVRQDEKVVGTLAVLRDITLREKNIAMLKAQNALIDRILSTMPDAVAVLDGDSNFVLANQALHESFGLRKDEVIGRHISELLPVKELQQAIDAVLAGKRETSTLEFRHTIAEKERIFVVNLFPMNENEILLVLDDVTGERDRQERLYLTDRLASVGEMASGIAHELNNPLTSVIGLSELLTEENLPEELREDIEAINQEAQRAAVIVRNLLTFARKHNPTRKPMQINDVISDVLRLRAYEHRVHNIKINSNLAEGLPQVSADYFQMQQVLLNVILNAENAVTEDRESGSITISSDIQDSTVRVTITDDGPGISNQHMARIFDPFFTTKEVGKGTGLGLSICFGIVRQHGGVIRAESEPHKGATFIIELPV